MVSLTKEFLRKLVTQQQISAAKQRGLVPQSGNWQKPRRWVTPKQQSTAMNNNSVSGRVLPLNQPQKPALSDVQREKLIDAGYSDLSIQMYDSNEKKIHDKIGRNSTSGFYGKNLKEIFNLGETKFALDDKEFNSIEERYNLKYKEGLKKYNVYKDKWRKARDKYDELNKELLKYRIRAESGEIESREEFVKMDKLQKKLDVVSLEENKAYLKAENFSPKKLAFDKFVSIKKDMVKNFQKQLANEKGYSAKTKKSILDNYAKLLDKSSLEDYNREDTFSDEVPLNAQLDKTLRSVAQLVPSDFYKGLSRISVAQHKHEGGDYAHYRIRDGCIDTSIGFALNMNSMYNTYAMIHEIGHSVHLSLFEGSSDTSREHPNRNRKFGGSFKVTNMQNGNMYETFSKLDRKKMVSEYAFQNEYEFFAENFATYFSGIPVKFEGKKSLALTSMETYDFMMDIEKFVLGEGSNYFSEYESHYDSIEQGRRQG